MKSLIDIIEALPVSGYKPAKPFLPRGPARPAIPAQTKAKIMTPRGRVTTVKSHSSMSKPGNQFIKYVHTPGAKPSKLGPSDKYPKKAKKPIKPVGSGI